MQYCIRIKTRIALNEKFSKIVLNKGGVKVAFNAHQHHKLFGNMMKNLVENHGIYSLWSEIQWDGVSKTIKIADCGPVWTLIVSPESCYGEVFDYSFDTYAILHLGKKFDQWTLEPKKIEIIYE